MERAACSCTIYVCYAFPWEAAFSLSNQTISYIILLACLDALSLIFIPANYRFKEGLA